MKVKYVIPLTALLVAGSEPATDATKEAYKAFFYNNQRSMGQVVEHPRSGLEKLIGGVAYAQDKAEATTYNPREQLRKLGWEVYDSKTDDLGGITPKEKLQFKITNEQFKRAYENNQQSIQSFFSSEEQSLIQRLLDGSTYDSEIKFVFVTPENRISLTLSSADREVGDKGLYVARKKLTPSQAENIRKISPNYKN